MSKIITFLSFMFYLHSYGAIIIPANGTEETNFAFTVPVRTKAFDPLSGSFIVGLAQGGGKFAISIASDDTIQFQGIAQNALLTNAAIEMLTLGEVQNPTSQVNELFIGTVLLNNNTPETNNVFTLLDSEGLQVIQSAALNDSNAFSALSSGIVNIAGGANGVFFAAVKGNAGSLFGVDNSGIALLTAELSNADVLSFFPLNAVTGGIGNLALPILINNTALFGGPGLTLFTNPFGPNLLTPLYWDAYLNRLYLGVSCQNDGAGNPFMSTVRLYVDEIVGNLIAQPITQTTAIDANNIVANVGPNQVLSTERLAVMHTSTGLSYLIVQATVVNQTNIFALPLVDDVESNNHGALANKNGPLIDGVFKTPAAAPGDLPNISDIAAQVGDPANIPTDLLSFIGIITDLVVVGDTVYVSISSQNNRFGYVLSSQALFNANGTIARWTPWAARAVPVNAFGDTNMPDSNSGYSGRVAFFSVDSATGKVWLVEGDTNRLVGLVTWTTSFTENSLPAILNKHFINGCYSSLDLHHKTVLIGLNNNNYSLFGGLSIIAFARTRDEALSATSPAGTITDFSNSENFLVTALPIGNIPITNLEYTSGNDNNYFLAGTPQGLYIFAEKITGAGFLPSDLTTLDQPPFTTSSWQLAPADQLKKAIISVVCAEDNIYIITFDPADTENAYQLLAIDPTGKTNIQDTFSQSNIRTLATSKQGVFEKIESFNSCAIVHTGTESTAAASMPEQLLLATNQGMWITQALQTGDDKGTATAQDETAAAWAPLDELQKEFFNGIGTIDTPIQHTAWPFYITQSSKCASSLTSILTQVSQAGNASNDTPPPPPFNPQNFNTNMLNNDFKTLDPIIYFWTDGARRFFIFKVPQFPMAISKIAVIPFDATNATINVPLFINDAAINTESQFYWIRSIGDLGIILAGTNSGVISLE
ncbi:MAG TPA: hypothetical protein VL201_02805 [Patescibacteria group bacterium]|jgi:hypothetical protein|nr:hypothetical protein [Patescibacteria group bacterium]